MENSQWAQKMWRHKSFAHINQNYHKRNEIPTVNKDELEEPQQLE